MILNMQVTVQVDVFTDTFLCIYCGWKGSVERRVQRLVVWSRSGTAAVNKLPNNVKSGIMYLAILNTTKILVQVLLGPG